MSNLDKYLKQIDTYMSQFETEYGNVWSNETALARYIENGHREFLEYWIEYVHEANG